MHSDSARPVQAGFDPSDWSTDVYVSRWQGGDEGAFGALYQRFAPLLAIRVRRSRVWPLLAGRFQIDDVVQEIWARAIPGVRKSFTPSGPGSFLAYLATLCDRLMIDLVRRLRSQKRGQGCVDHSLDTAFDCAQPLPGNPAIESPTSRARVSELEAIAREELSERELEAWNLAELQGFSAEEAGLAMECTGSAVRGLLLRGRAKLILRLGEDGAS